MKILLFVIGVLTGFAAFAEDPESLDGGAAMKISSPDFKPKHMIPAKFTCEGDDINPNLVIEEVPAGTKSLALIVEDPDSSVGTWVHWVVFDIPVTNRITEDSIPGKQGMNDFGRKDYGGPCPPTDTHGYYFKLYALDTLFNLTEDIDKKDLEKAMQGHILAKAELVGLYKRKGRVESRE